MIPVSLMNSCQVSGPGTFTLAFARGAVGFSVGAAVSSPEVADELERAGGLDGPGGLGWLGGLDWLGWLD